MARVAADRIEKREAMWHCVMRGYKASGMSIRAYCARHRVKEPAFYSWRAELARRDAGAGAKSHDAARLNAAFVPVVVKGPVGAGSPGAEGISIELRGRRVLRLPAMAVAQIAELVRLLEGDMAAGAA